MRKHILLLSLMCCSMASQGQSFQLLDITDFSNQRYNSNSVSWGDCDNDGDPDLFITNGESNQPNEFYLNEGQGKFKAIFNNLTEKNVSSFSSAWGDYNNDGWLDLYVANANYHNSDGELNYLFENNKDGTFTKKVNSLTVAHNDPSYGCSWVDYDNDGWLDLYVVNAYDFRNRLYRNMGNGSFVEIYGTPVSLSRHEISSTWCDYDNDGDSDLLVINTSWNSRNSMFINNGDGSFTRANNEITSKLLRQCRGASWGDYNNDGWMDLLLKNNQGEADVLFKNNGDGSFTEILPPDFIANPMFSGNAGQWGDFDNDGDLDLILSHHFETVSEFHRNNGIGAFEHAMNEWNAPNEGFAWSLTGVDVNLDGRLDIFQSNRFRTKSTGGGPERNMLFLNTTSNCNSYALVSLRGIESNYYGLGSRVRAYGTNSDGGHTMIKREMRCISGSGYTTQNGNMLHFGMEDWHKIDSIVVFWPSGIKTKYVDLPINDHIQLFENGDYEFISRTGQFAITAVRNESCPYNIEQLGTTALYNNVTWYKNGSIISDQNNINPSVETKGDLYVAEDECGNRDSIFINNKFLESKMFPNPAQNFVKFAIAGSSSQNDAFIKVYDIGGKFIMDFAIPLNDGFTEETMPIENLISGIYIVVIQSGCWETVEKLAVISANR